MSIIMPGSLSPSEQPVIPPVSPAPPAPFREVITDGTNLYPAGSITPLSVGNSGLPSTVKSKTANYTAIDGDLVLADASAGSFIITLPASGTVTVKKTDTSVNAVAVQPPSGTIDGDAAASIISTGATGIFQFAAAEWRLVSSNPGGPTVPAAPTVGAATGGSASASVAFTAPANTGGAAITSYTVVSTPGGITATGASSPINVTGLTDGTAYTFKVKATNSAGDSALSAASNSVTPFSGITEPTDIADLLRWYDANQIAGAVNTNKIASWPDMSGNAGALAQATSANQPAWYNAAAPAGSLPNGLPAVFFGLAGATTFMDSGALGDPAACTIFILGQIYAGTDGSWLDKAAGGSGRIAAFRASDLELFAGSSLVGALAGSSMDNSVLTFLCNGASSKIRKDGADLASGAIGANTLGSLRFGADQGATGGSAIKASISEIVVYSRALTPTEYGQVEAYLKTKYATA